MDRQPDRAVGQRRCFGDGRVSSTSRTSSSGDPYLPGNGDDSYHAEHYDLAITYRPATNRLDGHVVIDVVALREVRTLTFDLANLKVSKVLVGGARPKRFRQQGAKLLVDLGAAAAPQATLRVSITYSGHPAPINGRWGAVGWEELTDGALVAGQPNGAPSWYPCNDRPSDKATYRISVRTDSEFRVVANGVLVDRSRSATRTTWVYDQREPMAAYLATVHVGRFELQELPGSDVAQHVVGPHRLGARIATDFADQNRMMRCFTERFGPYPFAGYTAIVTDDPLEIPLEAQGISIFGSNHVDGRGGHQRLIAHELAHQWFGNSLTPARWSDIWLNEGFACYAEWLWSEDSGGPTAQDHAEREWRRLRDQPQDLMLSDPGPDLMFDDRLYKRGALAVHALRRSTGTTAFVQLVHAWTSNNRHGSVTTSAFVEHVERSAGAAVRRMLKPWLFERRLPDLPRNGKPRS